MGMLLFKPDGTPIDIVHGITGLGGTPSTQDFGDTADEGVSTEVARADHKHKMPASGGGVNADTTSIGSVWIGGRTVIQGGPLAVTLPAGGTWRGLCGVGPGGLSGGVYAAAVAGAIGAAGNAGADGGAAKTTAFQLAGGSTIFTIPTGGCGWAFAIRVA